MVPSASPARSAARSRVLAQRRHEVALRVEPADVDVAQMQVMHGDVAGYGKTVFFAARTIATPSAVERRHRWTRTPVSRTSAKIVASAIVSADDGIAARPSRVATSPSCATPPSREMRILRPQPHAVAERRRILHRPQQHLRVGERRFGLREGDAAGLRELAHLGQLLAFQSDRQRADRIHVRLVERARAMLQHFDEARLVERRIGVRAGTRGS